MKMKKELLINREFDKLFVDNNIYCELCGKILDKKKAFKVGRRSPLYFCNKKERIRYEDLIKIGRNHQNKNHSLVA